MDFLVLESKFTKFLSFLKQKINFYSNLAPLFGIMRHCKIIKAFYYRSTEDLSPMTLTSDAKFKEKLTCGFKYDMRNLVNFHQSTQKSEKFTSMGYFCPKYEVELNNTEELSFMTLKTDAKFE